MAIQEAPFLNTLTKTNIFSYLFPTYTLQDASCGKSPVNFSEIRTYSTFSQKTSLFVLASYRASVLTLRFYFRLVAS
jgi:hypothetical protein